MADDSWVKEFPGPVVVCDTAGIIIEMNERAVEWFADKGGRELVGKSVIEVHQEQSQHKIKGMMESNQTNVYTIERDGVRRLVYQSPWYLDGKFAGLVELLLEVPPEIPHHVRASSE